MVSKRGQRHENLSTVWGMVSAEGIESASQRKFNNIQSSGRQVKRP